MEMMFIFFIGKIISKKKGPVKDLSKDMIKI